MTKMLRTLSRYGAVFMIGLFGVACAEVDEEELASQRVESNVETTESDSTVTGQFKADGGEQVMVASSKSSIKESWVAVPPGSLAVDTAVTMQPGAAASSQALTELGQADAVVAGSFPPVLMSSSEGDVVQQPFTLNIPLPLDEGDEGADLLAASGKAAVLYYVVVDGQTKVGIYPLGSDDLEGAIVAYQAAGFGWFHLVVLSKAVDAKEAATGNAVPGAAQE
jgi:hypothetical protein